MTRGLTFSVTLHIVLVVFAIIGLPALFKPRPLEDRLMVVDVVTVGAVTNAPPPAEPLKKPDAPTQTAKAKPESPRTPPPPPSSAAAPPPPPKIDPPKVEAPEVEVPKAEPPKPEAARSAARAAEPVPTAEPVPAPKPAPQTAADAEAVPLPKPKPQEAKKPDPEAEAVALPKPRPEEKPKPEVAQKPEAKPKPEVAQKPEAKPKPEVAQKPEPEPEAPKPAEVAKPEPPTPEAPKPQPEPVKAAEATPAPPLPVSRPTPPKRPAERQTAARETPAPEKEKKPDKADDFLNVLKTVQKMKDSASTPAESEKNAPATADSTARRSNFDADRPLSVSEMDAIRQQIARCWLVPAGAKQGESLAVEIQVRMNPDRTVREAEVLDTGRLRSDPFFRAAAESALRALRNPSCTPLNLPPEKYETWKSFTITFDPRDMLS